jgi:uncharacterized MAPEG superfamily protein
LLTDAQSLVFSALLALAMLLVASLWRARAWTPDGMKVAFGNRERMPEGSPAAARADRAARNMIESLALFAAMMLAARLGGADHDGSRVTLGANVFFWSRVAYWPVYVAGIAYVRTLLWSVAVLGLAMVGLGALG